jgi:hypothetical protein
MPRHLTPRKVGLLLIAGPLLSLIAVVDEPLETVLRVVGVVASFVLLCLVVAEQWRKRRTGQTDGQSR